MEVESEKLTDLFMMMRSPINKSVPFFVPFPQKLKLMVRNRNDDEAFLVTYFSFARRMR